MSSPADLGEYERVVVLDSAGNIASFGGSGGTSLTDDAAFTEGTTTFTPVGGIVTADPVDAGDGGAFAMLANRQQKVTLYDSSGVELAVGGGTQYTEDAAAAANPVGNAPILVRADTPAGVTSTDGDNIAQRGTNYGAAYVQVVDSSGNYINSFGGGVQYTEGDADASITGTAALMEVAANTLQPVQGTVADGLLVNLGSNNDVVAAGDLAHDAVDSGNPLKIGGKASSSTPTAVAAGDRVDAWFSPNGTQIVGLGGVAGASADGLTAVQIPITTDGLSRPLYANPVFNGATFDRMRGDATNGVDVDVTRSALPTGASTLAEQQTQTTALQLIDDPVVVLGTATYTEAASKGNAVAAVRRDADTTLVDTTNEFAPLIVDARGFLKVEAFSGEALPITDNAGAITVDWNGTAPPIGGGTEATALKVTIASDSTGVLSVDDNGTSLSVDWNGTQPVTGSGTATGALRVELPTNGTGIVGLAAGTNNIGDVDVLTVPADPFGATADAAVVAGATGSINAHLRSISRDLVANIVLAAGSAAIGKLAANSGVDIGDVDVTSLVPGTGATSLGKAEDAGHTTGDTGVFALGVRTDVPNTAVTNTTADYSQLSTDMVGGLRTALYETDFAVLGTNHVNKYYTSTGAVTDGIIWSPAAGKRWYITDIFVNVSAAATVTIEDDKAGGDTVVWKAELSANGGWSHKYGTPLFSGEDAADLIITTSAGNVYVTVSGYEV